MASRAHERAQKILGNPTEEQLAQLIMHDISAQSANVEGRFISQACNRDTMRGAFMDSFAYLHASPQILACWHTQGSQSTERSQTSAFC